MWWNPGRHRIKCFPHDGRKPNRLETVTRSCHLSNKKNGKDKIFSFVHSHVEVNFAAHKCDSSNILIWGDTAPGSEKGKLHSLSHCDSGVDKYHACLRNKVGDTKVTHEALINGVNCRYDMNQQQWERGHWHGRVMRQQQALLSEWGRFYRHRPVVTASYFSCSTPSPPTPQPLKAPPSPQPPSPSPPRPVSNDGLDLHSLKRSNRLSRI